TPSPFHKFRLIGTSLRFYFKKGLYSGDALEEWVYDKLREKGIRTFADVPPGKLRIIASDITNGRLLVLPDDIAQYGQDPQQMEVARAVRMSTSIPFFFDPVMLQTPTSRKTFYIVDGGILSNFPMWLFDREYNKANISTF